VGVTWGNTSRKFALLPVCFLVFTASDGLGTACRMAQGGLSRYGLSVEDGNLVASLVMAESS
jgi:hypothetical protein